MWGATGPPYRAKSRPEISIHAPRVGSDSKGLSIITLPDYFNPRSPCGERRCTAASGIPRSGISIHAPRVGSDAAPSKPGSKPKDFNPRSPCGERQELVISFGANDKFQSTLPVWGATTSRTGSTRRSEFQSTLPVWGATSLLGYLNTVENISIHAPRVGSDCRPLLRSFAFPHFNPRSPCGERQELVISFGANDKFQSTLPVWGATTICQQK